MNVSTVLNTAADLIEERGWAQGPLSWNGTGDDEPRLCLEGGIMAAVGLVGEESLFELTECPAYRAVRDHLQSDPRWDDGITGGSREPWAWNDARGRTVHEVIATLRAAAVIAEAREVEDARHVRKVEAVRILHGNAAADRLAGAR